MRSRISGSSAASRAGETPSETAPRWIPCLGGSMLSSDWMPRSRASAISSGVRSSSASSTKVSSCSAVLLEAMVMPASFEKVTESVSIRTMSSHLVTDQ